MMQSDLAKTYLGKLTSTLDKEKSKPEKKKPERTKLPYTPTAKQIQDMKADSAQIHLSAEE